MIRSVSVFLKNISYNMMADFSLRVGNYILMILITRMLGITASGTYTVATNYIAIGLLISYWGFSNLVTREISKDKKAYERYFVNALVMRIILSVMAIIMIVIFVTVLDYDKNLRSIVIVLTLTILSGSVNHLIHAVFQAFEKIKYLSIASILTSILKIAAGYMILHSSGSLKAVVWLLVICDYAMLISYAYLITKYLPKVQFGFELAFSLSLIKSGLPFFGMMVLTVLDSRTETIIVSKEIGESAVGLLNPANAILGLFFLFPEGVRYSVLPLLVRNLSGNKESFQKLVFGIVEFILLITVPISVLVFLFAEELINLIFSDTFASSALFLKILVWTYIGYSLNVIVSRMLIALNQEKSLILAMFTSALITNIANLVLAPRVGLAGVAYVRLGTSLLLLLVCSIQLFLQGYHIMKPLFFIKLSLVTSAMIVSIGFIKVIDRWAGGLVGVMIFSLGLFVLKFFSAEELEVVRNVAKSILKVPSKTPVGE